MMSVIKNKWTYKVFSSISPGGSWRQEVEEFSPFCQKKPEITFPQFPISLFSIISTILPFCQKKPVIAFQDFSSFHNFTFLSEKARENISTISYFFFFTISSFFVRKSPRKHLYNFNFNNLFLRTVICQSITHWKGLSNLQICTQECFEGKTETS